MPLFVSIIAASYKHPGLLLRVSNTAGGSGTSGGASAGGRAEAVTVALEAECNEDAYDDGGDDDDVQTPACIRPHIVSAVV